MDGGAWWAAVHGVFQARVLEWGAIAFSISLFRWAQLFVTLWIVAHQAPLSMDLPRQKYRSGWQFPSPGDLPDPGIEPAPLMSPALAGRLFTTAAMVIQP